MIDKRFPNWDIDIEKGTIYSISHKKYIGGTDRYKKVEVKRCKGKGFTSNNLDGSKSSRNTRRL